jgi:glycerate kinase
MKILVAPDKFKGSLEAIEVCRATEEGIHLAFPEAEVISIPLADGGEGTTRILTGHTGGKYVDALVHDPLGRPITAQYGISGDGQTAFIEMALASGLLLLKPDEYDPMKTSTFGTGELIRNAMDLGVKQIIMGIGGSATNDGGIGMAAAMGYLFYDENGVLLEPIGQSLNQIRHIDSNDADPRLGKIPVTVACDVTNPLFGKTGASYIYGPQKGADPDMVEQLDLGLKNLSRVATNTFGTDVSGFAGAGAAGGSGAGALWFLKGELEGGVSIVMKYTGIETHIQSADLVITGEGKVDEQTLHGKVIQGLSDFCLKYNKPLAVVCGTLDISIEDAAAAGITSAVSILNKPQTLEEARGNAFGGVREATFHLMRLFFYNRSSIGRF